MKQFLNETIAFYEVQKSEQKVLKLLVIIAAMFPMLFFVYAYYQQTIAKAPLDEQTSNNELLTSLVISAVFAAALLLLFFCSKLETYVTSSGIHFRLFPFMRFNSIDFHTIEKYGIRQYKPMLEYGGWGIRVGSSGKAYNMHGNVGIQFVLTDNKKVLIGTQKPEEFHSALSQYVKTN